MARNERSLKATAAGCQKLTEALKNSRYTKSSIGDFVQYRKSDGKKAAGVSRATVAKAFNGDPVDRGIFIGLCDLLELDWKTIADLTAVSEASGLDRVSKGVQGFLGMVLDTPVDMELLRSQVKADLQRRCGTMKVLDMEQPIALNTIYTEVNVLEKLTANQRLSTTELLERLDGLEKVDRFCVGKVKQVKIPGLDAVENYKALMVLGRPGAGKTTFLKYLTISCLEGGFLGGHIPIFVTLKEWSELPNKPNLVDFIVQQWVNCGVENSQQTLKQCLKNGQALVLLDGLDEVLEVHTSRTIQDMRSLVDRFPKNYIVATCRIAAKEYNFETFSEVEVSDFSKEQIAEFVTNWFSYHKDFDKIDQFLEQLNNDKPILELASNPLLLTLLCLVFGDSGNFPRNRAKLYEEGVDLLLKKWDGKRNIQRDQVYKNLSINRKEDLLSQLALTTFQEGAYFFDQRVAEDQIMAYIHNLPDAKDDPEALRLDSEAILRSIVAQHGLLTERARGVYSFSHLTFQEYLAAREIAAGQNWQILAQHLLDKSWREVTLLAANSVRQGDELLLTLKQATDSLLADDPKLQAVLVWATEKAESVQTSYKLHAVIAFYLALARALDLTRVRAPTFDLAFKLTLNFTLVIKIDLDLNRARSRAIYQDLAIDPVADQDLDQDLAIDPVADQDLDIDRDLACVLARALDLAVENARALARVLDFTLDLARQLDNRDFVDQLANLQNQLKPIQNLFWEQKKKWWKNEGQGWIQALQSVMIEYRNIGHDWQFSEQQEALLRKYHDANLRLAECLNTDCYLSREVRQDIEATMLRPIAQIEAYYAAKGKPYPPVPNP